MTSKPSEGTEHRDGSPPKKSATSEKKRRRRRPSAKAVAERNRLIDIGAILNEPIEVLRDGKPGKMSVLEVAIRQQVKKALANKSLPAIMAVIKVAIDNDLVAPPPPQQATGGFFIVPKFLTEAEQRRIFEDQTDRSMKTIFDILRPYYE